MFNDIYKIIRRRLFFIFRKDYVAEQLKKRKGSCNHCSCCDMKFFGGLYDYNCPYLNKEKKCDIYKTDKWRHLCYSYPFDEKDKWKRFKDKCGFYWNE